MTSKRSPRAESRPPFSICRLWVVREERSVRQVPCIELDQWNQHPSFSTLFPGPSRGEVVVLRESLRTDLIVLAFLWSSESVPGEAAALAFKEDQMCSLEGVVYSCSRWRKDATFRASTACDNCMPALYFCLLAENSKVHGADSDTHKITLHCSSIEERWLLRDSVAWQHGH